MDTLSFEQIKELIEIATAKGIFDYFSMALPIIAVLVTYLIFKKHAVQIINEKVIEKEVEKLYEAVDGFFEYSDAVGLSFSMYEKKIGIILGGKSIDSTFDEKFKSATNAVYDNFRQVQKSSFLLRALGEIEVAMKIDSYWEQTVLLRKALLALMKTYEENNDLVALKDFTLDFSTKIEALNDLKNDCLADIALCKKHFKAIVN
jgi:hypothetical protein